MIDLFLVNSSSDAAESVAKKIATNQEPGGIVKVTREEMEAFNNDIVRIQPVGNNYSNLGMELLEIDLSKNYLLIAKGGLLSSNSMDRIYQYSKGKIKIVTTR